MYKADHLKHGSVVLDFHLVGGDPGGDAVISSLVERFHNLRLQKMFRVSPAIVLLGALELFIALRAHVVEDLGKVRGLECQRVALAL